MKSDIAKLASLLRNDFLALNEKQQENVIFMTTVLEQHKQAPEGLARALAGLNPKFEAPEREVKSRPVADPEEHAKVVELFQIWLEGGEEAARRKLRENWKAARREDDVG